MPTRRAMAIAAHPDDIEFLMAGTLLLLKESGFEIHYMTLSSGNCGSMNLGPARTRQVRRKESIAAAKILGANFDRAKASANTNSQHAVQAAPYQ